MDIADRYIGCLIGTAVGDSLLLPAEGLSRATVARRFPGPLRQRLVFGRGMVSDDTEHAFLTTQALLAAGDNADRFAKSLASRLRWWLLTLPGGCGKATAKGLIRSWLGVHPSRSGVQSAGNGPAMRSAIIGLRWADDPDRLKAFVTASTVLTHRDDRALSAALAVALAAAHIARGDSPEALWRSWRDLSSEPTWFAIVDLLERHHGVGSTVDAVATELGCPTYVSGYSHHSVPLALYAWLKHRHDPPACLEAVLRCGGDTDTIGAIAGALLGADGGVAVFPSAWRAGLVDWPLSRGRLAAAGRALADANGRPVSWWWPLQPVRNVLFLVVILLHVVRRLLSW